MSKQFSSIQKITLAAMLLAIAVVSGTLLKLISVPHFGFISFSFTPTIVIFASLALGPVYGAVVGVLSDLLPAFLYPTGAYNVILTMVFALLGILPWLFEQITKHFRKSLDKPWIVYLMIGLLFAAVVVIFYGTDLLDKGISYYGEWFKPVVLAVNFVFDVLLCVALHFTNRYYHRQGEIYEKMPSPNEIALIALFCEILLLVFLKGVAYYFYFFLIGSNTRVDYWVIVSMLFMASPINVLLMSVCVPWMTLFAHRKAYKMS